MPEAAQPLTVVEALIPIVSLILLIALSYYLFGDAGASGPNQVALVAATMIAVFIGWRRGHTLDALREAAVASVSAGLGAIFILATFSYLPYAIFNFASPLLTIAIALLGLRTLQDGRKPPLAPAGTAG